MIAMLTLALALSSECPREPMTKAGVEAAERDWVDAIEKGDSARLDCRLAPRFTDTNWQGKLRSRAQVLAASAGSRPRLSLEKVEVEVLGQTALVRGLNTQRRGDGVMEGTVRFTDIFVYHVGRWQAVSAQETVVRE